MIIFKKLVAADTTYQVANQSNCTIFDVHNDTPYNAGVSFGRDTGADNADYFMPPHSSLTGIRAVGNAPSINSVKWVGTIYLYTETPLGTGTTNLSAAPAFQLTMIGYPTGYQPSGSASMSRMSSTPNMVNTNVSSTNSIVNTGNPLATSIITVQPTGASGNTWTADNSGNLTIKQDVAGTLLNLLQLVVNAGAASSVRLGDASGLFTEIMSTLQVDGNLDPQGNLIMLNNTPFQIQDSVGTAQTMMFMSAANELTIRGPSQSNKLNIQTAAGGGIAAFNASGITLQGGTLALISGSLSRMTVFNGTGSGTVNTGLGTTPTTICTDCCSVSGSTQTIGFTNATSSVVTTGAGLAWNGTAIKT